MTTTYAILLPGDENAWEALSPDEQAAVFARHDAFSTALEARGHRITGGAELTHSRETRQVRRVGGEVVVTDGPYAETVEQLSGFYLVESDDVDDLVEVAAMLADDGDGAVEVRACQPGPDAGAADA
ncbi:transcription initiation protein [Nocardioides dongxiaopingii]|uniref:YciI family protein n=1 Tax=Nocardioides TaxID=1839 RepID=UPI0010C7643D|nr:MULTISPECIES: YciI family protein [Nocardioides]QDH11118.1 transcription initiation protein [Nocardioides sp. S-1144]